MVFNGATIQPSGFFRDKDHFLYLAQKRNEIRTGIQGLNQRKLVRAWCVGCSTGEEAVSLAIILIEALGQEYDICVLATDISESALSQARSGWYSEQACSAVPKPYLSQYFFKSDKGYETVDDIRQTLHYCRVDVMNEPVAFKEPFDFIFCRNVMINMDSGAQSQLIDLCYDNLYEGGLLMIGLGETLCNIRHRFVSKAPSIYMK